MGISYIKTPAQIELEKNTPNPFVEASMKAITPREAKTAKQAAIPAEIFNVFNAFIVAGLSGGDKCATVKQEDVVSVLVGQGFDRQEIYRKNYLDIEDHYRKAGWVVTYDKPGYNESYKATFTFKAKK